MPGFARKKENGENKTKFVGKPLRAVALMILKHKQFPGSSPNRPPLLRTPSDPEFVRPLGCPKIINVRNVAHVDEEKRPNIKKKPRPPP